MNIILINNILATVKEGDTLIIVGDVVMGQRGEMLKHLVPIRDAGVRLQLVAGNHDYCHPLGHKKHAEWTKIYRVFFDEVALKLFLEFDDFTMVLNHFPLTADHTEEEMDKFRPVLADDEILIHGHLHTSEIRTSDKELHIGVDSDWTAFGVERFHPVPLEVVAGCII